MFSPAADVPTFTLSDGSRLPVLFLGNGTGAAAENALETGLWALHYGARGLDTAAGYNNEEQTGEAFRQSGLKREDVYITSKLSQKDANMENPPTPVDKVRESVLATIERLGTQPDLLLIHAFTVPPEGQIVPFWQILEKMKDDGELTSSIGLSNFLLRNLAELLPQCKYLPVCIQAEFHPYMLNFRASLLEVVAKYNILLMAYGPLTPLLRHPNGGGPLVPVLSRIAERLTASSGQKVDSAGVLLLWTYSMGCGVVTASGNEERIRAIARLQALMWEGKGLTPDEVLEIASVGKAEHLKAY